MSSGMLRIDGSLGLRLKKDCEMVSCDGFYKLHSEIPMPDIGVNPVVAAIIEYLESGYTINHCVDLITKMFSVSEEIAINKINSILEVIDPFFEPRIEPKIKNALKTKKILSNRGDSSKRTYSIKRHRYPQYIVFNLTDMCNRRCIYCFEGAKYQKDPNEKISCGISTRRFSELIKEAQGFGCKGMELGGGDPFCIFNINEYIKIAIESKIPFTISTKHYISDAEVVQLKKIGLKKIQISIDSHLEQTADMMMGYKGAYNEIISTIENFINNDIAVRLKFVVTSLNADNIDETIRFFIKKGVSEFAPNLYGMSCGRHNRKLYPTREQLQHFDEITANLIAEYCNSDVNIEYTPGLGKEFFKRGNGSMVYKNSMRGVCASCTYSQLVRGNGDVLYCAFLSNHPDFIIGNAITNSLIECWDSQSIEQLRNPDRSLFKDSPCYECDDFTSCIPKRCYFRTSVYNGTPYGVDPWCKYGDPDFTDY